MPSLVSPSRTGITLMEVLISIGILSIGLAGVLALIPAGGREAQKALIADRRASLAANAMSDAIARGILNPANWSAVPGQPYAVAFDPLGSAVFPVSVTRIDLTGVVGAAAEEVFRAADDLAYEQPADEDLPALPRYTGGQRITTGAFSWLATLLPAGTTDGYRLSIVTFHLRQVPPTIVTPFAAIGANGSFDIALPTLALSNDDFRETFTRGTPVLLANPTGSTPPVWRTIVLVMPQTTGGAITAADITLDAEVPFVTTQLYAFPGAVGVAEKFITLEGMSPWSL